MLAKVLSVALVGVDAEIVEIEVDVGGGLPGFFLVGLPDKAVQESRDRVRAALIHSDYQHPNRKIVANLAPADLKKEGAVYDLALALGTLVGSEQIGDGTAGRYLVLGELALDGAVRPVPGVLAAAITARQRGFAGVIVPAANGREARAAGEGLDVVPVATLREAVGFVAAGRRPPSRADEPSPVDEADAGSCFSEVRGQEQAKRALEVAAAGGHNILLLGPPGSGKTMCAQRLPSILPELGTAESLETTKIHSVAGLLKPGQGLLRSRPFRAPHHSVSVPGLVGGGANPRPGEVSLAHNGVLFLDEAPEFSRHLLETLRQPLEDGAVTISRASGSATYPARIMLVLSANLCPCGRLGDPRKACRCTPPQVAQYLGRLSGPLLDRVDLVVEVPAVEIRDLRGPRTGEPSAAIRARVEGARARQRCRYADRSSPVNARMTHAELEAHCALDAAGENLLRAAVSELGLSARGATRVLKVARTIADLEGADAVGPAHLAEAVAYKAERR